MPATRIADFDTWRPGYGLATVRVLRANTTTLADLFLDEALTKPATNPQVLLERTVGSISYGKFGQPLYTSQAFELQINSVDSTGIDRPALTSLDNEDASQALVTATGATEAVALADRLSRSIDVRDFGQLHVVGSAGASAAGNTAAIVAAIGRATLQGGGDVQLPSGTFDVTPFSIPLGVTVSGVGPATTTLQCTQASRVVTVSGDRAGLRNLTLDGVSKVAASVGFYSLGRNRPVLDNVQIKRFETGAYLRGGEQPTFSRLTVSDCSYGARLHGDKDTAGGGAGTTMQGTRWTGGRVEFCSIAGVELKYIDLPCIDTLLAGIGFFQNIGSAVRIQGARSITIRDSWWDTNAVNLEVLDGAPLNVDNTVIDLVAENGRMVGGQVNLKDTLENVVFKRLDLQNVTVTLTTPKHTVMAQDCREQNVTLNGIKTSWGRSNTTRRGSAAGFTTGNAATKAWGLALAPGQRVLLTARVIGRGRTNADDAFYFMAVSAKRPGAALAYDTQTGQFTAGNIVTGATSGASGRIVADADGGTTGTLTLQDVNGDFVDNEIITDGATGSATANGALTLSNAALAGAVTDLRAVQETAAAWAATFVANGPEIELQVTGEASKTIEWTVDVDVVTT